MNIIKRHRYLISRRIVQIGLLILFAGSNYAGWNIFKGNYSSGVILDTIPLSDPYAVLQILFSGFLAGSDLLIGALIVLVIYGLLFGRIFCSWICPLNIVSDTALNISNRLKVDAKFKVSTKTRYGVLVLGLILSSILGLSAFEIVSPVSILHRGLIFGIGAGWAVIAAIFLFDIAVLKNGWCGHLCPLGAFYSLIGRYALLKVKHNSDNCTNCNRCFAVCHEPQVLDIIGKQNGVIKSGECTNCARCIEVCDDDALGFSISNNFIRSS